MGFLINIFSHKKNARIRGSRARFMKEFFARANHRWIVEDHNLHKSITRFLRHLPLETLQNFNKLILIPCTASMSAAVSAPKGTDIVLVFPQLRRYLCSADPFYGYAILAHELGHILCDHSNVNIDPIAAQVEADAFAWRLGFGEELLEILRAESDSEETILRQNMLKEWNAKLGNSQKSR